MPEGRDSLGLKIRIKPKSGGSYVEVPLAKSFDDGGLATGKIDYTHSQSPNRSKQYKAGWNDPQEYSFEHHWSPEGFALVRAAQVSGEMQAIEVTVPEGPNGEEGFVDEFDGFVTSSTKSGDGTSDDTIGFSWAVQVDGLIGESEESGV